MRGFFLLAAALPLLASCVSQEEEIRRAIAEANRCETAEDCALAGGKCPFDCYVYVHASEQPRITAMIDAYLSTCMYGCVESFGVECVQNTCRTITKRP